VAKVKSVSVADSLARATKGIKQQKTNKNRKYGRNRVKCARYRDRVGKPRGRYVSGNKRGKNKT
jgi:hypothetical protein